MTDSRSRLLDELAADLAPVRRPGRSGGLVVAWLVGSWAFVCVVTLATGPLRPGVAQQLGDSPRFLAESLFGLLAGFALVAAAAGLGIPRSDPLWRRVGPALLLAAAWAGAYLYGLLDPALEPSMVGKRAGCYLDTLLYAAPPLAAGLWLLRRLAPLRRAWTGALVGGAAAGAIPGLLMQLACMYVPTHILSHHIAPILGLAALGALLGPLTLRRI